MLGISWLAASDPLTYDRAATTTDVASVKGLLEMLVARLAGARLVYETTATRDRVEHPGRTAAVAAIPG